MELFDPAAVFQFLLYVLDQNQMGFEKRKKHPFCELFPVMVLPVFVLKKHSLALVSFKNQILFLILYVDCSYYSILSKFSRIYHLCTSDGKF